MLVDKGYMGTALSLDSVRDRDYSTYRKHSLLIIYVPKGTPCAYVDLISDMNENEILFASGVKLKVLNSFYFGKIMERTIIKRNIDNKGE